MYNRLAAAAATRANGLAACVEHKHHTAFSPSLLLLINGRANDSHAARVGIITENQKNNRPFVAYTQGDPILKRSIPFETKYLSVYSK